MVWVLVVALLLEMSVQLVKSVATEVVLLLSSSTAMLF